MIDYHDAHAGYITAVTKAARTAGIHIKDSWHDGGEPRNGVIETEPTPGTGPGLSFVWIETCGWFYGHDDGHGMIPTPRYFGGCVLPPPEETATFMVRIVTGDRPNDGEGWFGDFFYRDADEIDPAFEAELTQYQH